MTSLTETLPILDEAVPALPGKMEAMARASEQFHREAHETLGLFRAQRQEAEGLVEEVRQAFDAIRQDAGQEQERVERLSRELERAVEEEARGGGEAAGEVRDAGDHVVEAFQALESTLTEAGDRTQGAQQDAREALDALTAEAKGGGAELESATGAMVSAVGGTQKAIEEGQAQVTNAVNALKDTLLRLLASAAARLARTRPRLEHVRETQEEAVDARDT